MGKDKTIDLCAWFNEQPRLTARINTVKVSIEDCLKELRDLGWTVEQDNDIPEVVYIDAHQGHLEKQNLLWKVILLLWIKPLCSLLM